jgi:hypothetical protein
MPTDGSIQRAEISNKRSGVVDWVHYRLESGSATVEIDCKRLLTQYATRCEDGKLTASQHQPASLFQAGPGISLPPGNFSVVFLGTADPNMVFELAVTSRNRRQIFSKNLVTADKPLLDELGTLSFALSREEIGIEFIIGVQSSVGMLTSRGMRIIRRDAFDPATRQTDHKQQRSASALK